ncbi:MAG: type 1 glutamine amidotransferase [Deltaproteobacteria bacterium]|nr:type 1 glutamine amidotransferase [Deltaproteobacteria bacterium]
MELSKVKAAMLLEEMFNDFEMIYPYYRLQEAGAEVTVVGPRAGAVYRSKLGLPWTAKAGMDQVKPEDFDAIVIPGGYAPDHMRRHKAMVNLVREIFRAGKVVAAICHGGWMLASAEVVQDRDVTSFFSIRDDLRHAGARWRDQEVVVDGNLITSRQPDDLPAFMREVLKALERQKN